MQGFILRFIERNYERRTIDEESFQTFNKFVSALSNEMNQDTAISDIKVFVSMIDTVFINYNEPSCKKSTYGSVLQLMELCFRILQRGLEQNMKPECIYEIMNLFWPIYDANKPIEEKNYENF